MSASLIFDLSDPLCLANIRACCAASQLVYSRPDITSGDGESALIQDCGNCIVVAFPGTHDIEDVLRDMDALRREVMIAGKPCSVHKGFDDAFNSILGQSSQILQSHPIPFFITGHSKGAAVAKRFALELASSGARCKITAVVTFGEPRGGDARYAKIYGDVLGQRTLRVNNAADPIPWVPGWLAGNRHCGPEGFMPAGKNYLVTGPALISKVFSDGLEIWRNWQLKELDPMNDHHIDNYIRRVNALA